MSDLRTALGDYLAVRRALGYKLHETEHLLGQFVAHCEASGVSTITTEVALEWATLPAGADPSWWAQRLSKVRCFARWLQALDSAAEVPPTDILSGRPRRAVPYLYSDAEIVALMTAARGLRTPLKAETFVTLIGLLAVTGLRGGEAIRLGRGDVLLDEALVRVVKSKFNKSREVPLHETSVNALRHYQERRDELCPNPPSDRFFVSTVGTMLDHRSVRATFKRLTREAGLSPRGERCRPRIHDLRHSLACSILLEWHRQGVDVHQRLPLLSTFLGHAKPENTYWYLTETPELLGYAVRRLEEAFEAER
jgi:integrase